MLSLHHADARDVIPTLSGPVYVLTDPPFGKALMAAGSRADRGAKPAFRTRRLIAGDEDAGAGVEVLALCRDRGWPVLAFADPLKPWPGDWRQTLVWDKGEAVGIGGDRDTCWKFSHELIQVGRFLRVLGGRDSSVLRFPVVPGACGDHYARGPAEKPVRLMRYLVGKLVPPGGTVFDPFMGSGATGLACLQLGRPFVGVEIDAAVFAGAKERLDAAARGGLFAGVNGNLFGDEDGSIDPADD